MENSQPPQGKPACAPLNATHPVHMGRHMSLLGEITPVDFSLPEAGHRFRKRHRIYHGGDHASHLTVYVLEQ
ncbi:hypothetical protein [Parapedobacter tibetensis]|uniref:hypothetical protein n=1 Tax=Parapedobacter tibetensis TaxID=2972951 RepID=UPI00214D8106|nr:hypothetical protein [Parapedobacter tibetensis]